MQGLEAALTRKNPEAKIFLAPRSWGFLAARAGPRNHRGYRFRFAGRRKGARALAGHRMLRSARPPRETARFPIVLVLLDGQPAPGLPFLRQLHWIISADPASEKSIQVMDAAAGGGALPGELWRHTAPYRGLAAMTEADTDFFLGRGRETVELIEQRRKRTPKSFRPLGTRCRKSSLRRLGCLLASSPRSSTKSRAGGSRGGRTRSAEVDVIVVRRCRRLRSLR